MKEECSIRLVIGVLFSLSVELLIVVKNLGHVLGHTPVKKAAFSLHSRTTPWLRRTSQMLHLRKTERLYTSPARFRRLIVFERKHSASEV